MRRDNERCRVSPVGNMSTVALATRFRDSHLRPRLDFVAARHANSSACHGPFNPDQDSEFVVVVKFCTFPASGLCWADRWAYAMEMEEGKKMGVEFWMGGLIRRRECDKVIRDEGVS